MRKGNELMWIDMKDSMPAEGEYVIIIYDCCGEPDIDIMKRVGEKNSFTGPRGFLCGDVTHWKPLNPLPKMYENMQKKY